MIIAVNFQFKQLEIKKPEKKFRAATGFEHLRESVTDFPQVRFYHQGKFSFLHVVSVLLIVSSSCGLFK